MVADPRSSSEALPGEARRIHPPRLRRNTHRCGCLGRLQGSFRAWPLPFGPLPRLPPTPCRRRIPCTLSARPGPLPLSAPPLHRAPSLQFRPTLLLQPRPLHLLRVFRTRPGSRTPLPRETPPPSVAIPGDARPRLIAAPPVRHKPHILLTSIRDTPCVSRGSHSRR